MAISTLSKPTVDLNYRRLAVAILTQAVKDLLDPDPIKALDALTWLLFGGSDFYLEGLDIEGGWLALLQTIQAKGDSKSGKKINRLVKSIS